MISSIHNRNVPVYPTIPIVQYRENDLKSSQIKERMIMAKRGFIDYQLKMMGLLPPELYDLKDIAPMSCIEWVDEIISHNLLEEEREKERELQEKKYKRRRTINNIFFTLFMVFMASMGVGLGKVLEYIGQRN